MSARQRAVIEFLLDNLVWLLLIVVLAAFSIAIPNYFQIGIFTNIIEDSTYVGVMAIGLAIVIIAGNMDLSVESVAGLTAVPGRLVNVPRVGESPVAYRNRWAERGGPWVPGCFLFMRGVSAISEKHHGR